MTRDWDTPPAVQGRVELIEQRGFVTRGMPADRVAQAYRPGDRLPRRSWIEIIIITACVAIGLALVGLPVLLGRGI